MEITQANIESVFSKRATKEYIHDLLLENTSTMHMIGDATDLLTAWTEEPAAYTSKQERKDTLSCMNIQEIVEKLFVNILTITGSMTLASLSSQLGSSLGFEDTKQGITLAAEIIAVVLPIGLYQIGPLYPKGQWHVIPNIELSPEERVIAEQGMYIPPSITKPLKLKHNRDSGYASLKGESLILGGSYKHHDGDICLDVLNKQNKIPLSLCEDFLLENQEERKKSLDEIKEEFIKKGIKGKELHDCMQREAYNWYIHCQLASMVYELMVDAGNHFYVTNKYDMRGRLYAQGHHINPMGSSYKKSSVELKHKEKVDVPEGFFRTSI